MVTRDIVQRLLNVINDTRRRVNTLESREYVLLNATQTLTNKTLTTPSINNFTNAQHSHANAAGGGQLSLTTAVSGVLPAANGGTGVDNATRTLTINANSGTLAFSGAGFTLTVPKTGTVPVGTGTAGRIAEWVTDANTVQASTLAKTGAGVLTLAAAANYTLTVPATGTAALLGTEQTFTERQTIQTTDDLPLSVRSTSSFTDLRLGNGTLNLIDFRSWDGTVLYGRLQLTVATNIFSIQTRRVNGIIDLMTGNSAGTLTQAVRVTGTQSVLINTTTDNAQLSVNQSSATGAKPALRLRQADLSEELIRFDATVGTGNPINTTALDAYYGRVRVWVEGVGAKWLALYD